jgi:hypothetical protein
MASHSTKLKSSSSSSLLISLCSYSLQGIPPLTKLSLTVRRFDRLPLVIGLYGSFIPLFVVFTHSPPYCNHTVWFAPTHNRHSFLPLSFPTHSNQLFRLFVFPCDIQLRSSCAVQIVSNNTTICIVTFCFLHINSCRVVSWAFSIANVLLFWVVYGTPLFLL